MSWVTTVSCWLSNSFPRLYFKVLSLTCWCKVQLEFSKTWGSKWMTEEKYLRCTLCHKLRKKNLHRKKQQKPQILSMHPFKKCFFFFLNFWKQLNVNQKQFLSNCSKQCLFKIYIFFCNLGHFGSALIYVPSFEFNQFLSFPFTMCKYNSISSESWSGADVSGHFCVTICISVRPGFQSHCRSQFSWSHKTCESHSHFTFSSLDVVTATCGACCRLSGASLLCDLPSLCLNTVFEFFLGMGRAL